MSRRMTLTDARLLIRPIQWNERKVIPLYGRASNFSWDTHRLYRARLTVAPTPAYKSIGPDLDHFVFAESEAQAVALLCFHVMIWQGSMNEVCPLRAANLSVLEPEPKGFKLLGEANATLSGGMSYAHVDGPTTPEFDTEADLFFKAEILLHPAIHLVQEGDAPPQGKARKRA